MAHSTRRGGRQRGLVGWLFAELLALIVFEVGTHIGREVVSFLRGD